MTEPADWRPKSGPGMARNRAAMLQRTRAYFAAIEVLEVDTPALSQGAVSDPHIESITASLSLAKDRDHYLHTSPEYCMKRLLCAGYPDIYQIAKVFRDDEAGRHHQPEFTMVEWYRLNFSLKKIIDDTLAFIATAIDDHRLQSDAQRLSYCDAYRQLAGCDVIIDDVATLADAAGADDTLKRAVGNNKDAWLDLLLGSKVTPRFPTDRLTVLYHYPLSQAALARQCPENDKVADRFEVFLGRHELANGYVELTGPDEHAKRFAHDKKIRQSRAQKQRPLDAAFLAALQSGLPPCAGVAVGFDRLLMIASGAEDIRDVQTFSFVE